MGAATTYPTSLSNPTVTIQAQRAEDRTPIHKRLAQKPRNAFESSQRARSKRAKPGWFSQRVKGEYAPCVGTIRNTRAKIRRNKRVSILGAPPEKFKRTAVYRLPIPTEVI